MELPVSGLWFVVPILAGAAMAQAAGAHKTSHVGADVFGGYTYVSPDFGLYNQSSGQSGADAGVDIRFTRMLAATVEADFFRTTYNPEESSRSTTLLAGPRLFIPLGRVTPFADILGGVATFTWNQSGSLSPFTSNISGAVAADSGLDVRLTRHV